MIEVLWSLAVALFVVGIIGLAGAFVIIVGLAVVRTWEEACRRYRDRG